MNYHPLLLALVINLLLLGCADSAPEKPTASIQDHIDKAYTLAGDSFMKTTVDLQCTDKIDAMSFFKDVTVPPPTQVSIIFILLASVQ